MMGRRGESGRCRRSLRESIAGKVDKIDADVRTMTLYAKPDHFDREWQLTRTLPFVHRVTRVTPDTLREVAGPASSDLQHLAKAVITRLVIPMMEGATRRCYNEP